MLSPSLNKQFADAPEGATSTGTSFETRLARHEDELRDLYMGLYHNAGMYRDLIARMRAQAAARSAELKSLDEEREAAGAWYRSRDMLGMQMYIENFAGTLKGMREKLDYLAQTHVNYLHLMPFLDTPADKSRSDGGYAVADFRRVNPALGTMDDLAALAHVCHERGISLCMDFVMNHTSEDHEWARRARAGEPEYMARYFFTADEELISRYTVDVPQVFPTTAPGHFTYLPELGQYVMTQFYPYQWDLNYKNPRVFNEMMENFLFLANQGIDIMRIDAVPYIWKELGTNCRNLPQVHDIVRMMRIIGEVVMAPVEVAPYFGAPERPECHMLYNVTTMATTWHPVATRDTRLLRMQMGEVCRLPRSYTFLNYLRCHDDIGWGLDYPTLSTWGMEEVPHKKYLNDYFLGDEPGSVSRGELYNADPVTGDARFCATTASMCGVEVARAAGDAAALDLALTKDVMLHAYMLAQSGLPIIYSGDEVLQENDYSYRDDPEKVEDSRYIHRGAFPWDKARLANDASAPEGRMFKALQELEAIRRREKVFDCDAEMTIQDYSDPAILWVVRRVGAEVLHAVFNFSDESKTLWMPFAGTYRDLVRDECATFETFEIPAWDFRWFKCA